MVEQLIETVVCIDNHEFLWCFYVVAHLSNDIVLGMDWLASMKVDIQCATQTLLIGKHIIPPQLPGTMPSSETISSISESNPRIDSEQPQSLPFPFNEEDHFSINDSTYKPPSLFSDSNDSFLYNVRVRKRTILPPQSFTKVSLRCMRKLNSDVLFAPKKTINSSKQLAFGASILKMKDGLTHTYVLNLGSSPVQLCENLTVGSCSKHDDEHIICDLDAIESQKKDNPRFQATLAQLENPVQIENEFQQLQKYFKFGDNLSSEEKAKILALLRKYTSSFSSPNNQKLGRVPVVEHEIDVGDSKPIKQRAYRVSFKERQVINDQVDELLRKDIIEHSQSPWSSPVVLVKKPNGGIRFCVDYRKLNVVTKRDNYPLPRIDDALDRLSGASYFTTLDCDQAYYQIPMNPSSKDKTAFITPDGLFQFKVLPFGLANSPAVFQRLIDSVLGRLKWTIALVYMDDLIAFSKNFDEHLDHIDTILAAVSKAGLILQATKCSFGFSKLKYLGHIISKNGVEVDPEKVRAVKDFPLPKKVKNVQSFVALCSYYRRFIPQFSHIAKPLHDLTKKDVPFNWTDIHQAAFDGLKELMCSTPILGYPDEFSPTEIHCDGSSLGLGCTIVQKQEGIERVIAYASRSLRRHEVNYSATDLECLAVLFSIQKFRPYLYGRHFKIITDHSALCNLINFKDPHGRAARWSMALQPYDFEVVHRAGKKHADADAFSRNPVKNETPESHVFCKPHDDVDDLCKLGDGRLYSLCAVQSDDFPNLQYNDPKLMPIIDALLHDGEDNFPVDKRLVKQLPDYQLLADILYKAHYHPNGRLWRLVVPESLQKDLICEIHCAEASHLGLHKTFALIRDRYYWPGMFRSVCNYVRSCKTCQLYNRRVGRPPGALQPITPPKVPFVRIGIDFVGPFPMTHPRRNTSILTIIDHLTRYVEAYPCKGETTAAAIEILKEKIFLKHSVPKVIIADKGSAFTAHEFRNFCKEYGISLKFCTTAHPETNAVCERSHDVLQRTMAKLINKDKDWDKFVTLAAYKYNISEHSVIKMSPFYALFGRTPRLISDNKLPISETLLNESDNNAHIENAHEAAIQAYVNTVDAQEKSKREFDKLHPDSELFPGDLVLLRAPRIPGRVLKLQERWQGPFKVIEKVYPLNYKVVDVRPLSERPKHGKSERIINVRDIKKYYVDPDDPRFSSFSSSDEFPSEFNFVAGSLTSFDSAPRNKSRKTRSERRSSVHSSHIKTSDSSNVNRTPKSSVSSKRSPKNNSTEKMNSSKSSSSKHSVFDSASDGSVNNVSPVPSAPAQSVVYNISNVSTLNFSTVPANSEMAQQNSNSFQFPLLPPSTRTVSRTVAPEFPPDPINLPTGSESSSESGTSVRSSSRIRHAPQRYQPEDFTRRNQRTRSVGGDKVSADKSKRT